MVNNIGKILRFDGANFNENINRYAPIIVAVEKVKEFYEALDPSFKFTNDVFGDLLINKIKTVSEKYKGVINSQLKAANFTAKALVLATEQGAEKNLSELSAAVEKVLSLINDQTIGPGRTYIINAEYVRVLNNKIVLDPKGIAVIRKVYEDKIETEKENEFYDHLLNVQNAYRALRNFVQAHTNFEVSDTLIGDTTRELMCENAYKNGELEINSGVLGFLK